MNSPIDRRAKNDPPYGGNVIVLPRTPNTNQPTKYDNNHPKIKGGDIQGQVVGYLFPRPIIAMTADEIKSVVKEVLAEQRIANRADLDDATTKTIATILLSFGIEEGDRKEIQADFQHLRKWRKSVEQTQSYAFKTIVTVIVGGFLGALWLGIKATMGK